MRRKLRFEGGKRALDLLSAPFLFVARDQLFALLEELAFAAVEVDGDVLVQRGHLRPEVSAAGMHDEELLAVRRSVDFDEVVAAAERAQAST